MDRYGAKRDQILRTGYLFSTIRERKEKVKRRGRESEEKGEWGIGNRTISSKKLQDGKRSKCNCKRLESLGPGVWTATVTRVG